MNLREQAEADLAVSLEDQTAGFGLPVELIGPDGTRYTGLVGQVLYDTTEVNQETGAPLIVHNPVVTLRRSSLTVVPVNGEDWACRIPITPSTTAALATFMVEQVSEDGGSIGFIRLYLTRAAQS